jgi:hypothetical protein
MRLEARLRNPLAAARAVAVLSGGNTPQRRVDLADLLARVRRAPFEALRVARELILIQFRLHRLLRVQVQASI